MKYQIKLGGRGADFFVHSITEKQIDKLSKFASQENNQVLSSPDNVSKVTGIKELDQSDISFTGIYDEAGNISIEVYDDKSNVVFDSLKSSKSWYFNEETRMENDNYECYYESGNYLFVEYFGKGCYLEFELETDKFDPNKLSPVQSEINERFILITGLCYDGEKLEHTYGDYAGKGTYYYLSLE